MTIQYKSRFVDNKGNVFKVNEVSETPVGLTVFYSNESTGEKYSCLLEAFSQRFREVPSD